MKVCSFLVSIGAALLVDVPRDKNITGMYCWIFVLFVVGNIDGKVVCLVDKLI